MTRVTRQHVAMLIRAAQEAGLTVTGIGPGGVVLTGPAPAADPAPLAGDSECDQIFAAVAAKRVAR